MTLLKSVTHNAPDNAPSVFAANHASVHFIALAGVPAVKPGDDLVEIILAGLVATGEELRDGDVLILAQKIVSKAQDRLVPLSSVEPTERARQLAREVNKDARLVELILQESTEVIRQRPDLLIVGHRLGFVVANAGIDFSNVQQGEKDEAALLLPKDPDVTCAQLRAALLERTKTEVGIIISDSHGRAFRNGTTGVAIGASGLSALADLRGWPDLYGRRLQHTQIAVADEIASAASLLMGQANEARPIVLARGIASYGHDGNAASLVRAKSLDVFRDAGPNDPYELLVRRRSVRRYTPDSVSKEVIDRILWAATCAPSAHNSQPWRFVVLQDGAAKERLAREMGRRLRSDRLRDRDDPEAIEADIARSHARITGAPVAILVCLTMENADNYRDQVRRNAEHQMAVQSTAMAMQNLQIAATAMSLGANIMCAPLFCQDVVRDACALPPDWEPQALVTIGYPANAGKPFARRALSSVVRYLGATE